MMSNVHALPVALIVRWSSDGINGILIRRIRDKVNLRTVYRLGR